MSIDRECYPGVPADFPITKKHSALPGAKAKLSLIEEGGKLYAPGASPSEVAAVFAMCDDLVQQMVPYCERKLAAFDGNQNATAKAVFRGLLSKDWCSPEQSAWIMRQVAKKLGWSLKASTLRS